MTHTQPAHAAGPTRVPADRLSSRRARRIGAALTAFVALFLLFDSVIHLLGIRPVVDSFAALGYPVTVAFGVGLLELLCIVLYLVPRTSVLGAVLLTGYLGGAVSAQLRVDSPLFSTLLFPVYVGIVVWAGLFLRDARLRRLFPLRTAE